MTQCNYKTHRKDPHTFKISMQYQYSNCCVGIRKEYATNITMLRGVKKHHHNIDFFYYDNSFFGELGNNLIFSLIVISGFSLRVSML